DGRGHGRTHAEVEDGEVAGGGRLHGAVAAGDLELEAGGGHLVRVGEVGEEDVLAELLGRAAGVAREPVADDLVLGLHAATVSGLRVRVGALMASCSGPTAMLRTSSSRSVWMVRPSY